MIRKGAHQLAFLRRSVKVLLGAKKVLTRRAGSDSGVAWATESGTGVTGIAAMQNHPQEKFRGIVVCEHTVDKSVWLRSIAHSSHNIPLTTPPSPAWPPAVCACKGAAVGP